MDSEEKSKSSYELWLHLRCQVEYADSGCGYINCILPVRKACVGRSVIMRAVRRINTRNAQHMKPKNLDLYKMRPLPALRFADQGSSTDVARYDSRVRARRLHFVAWTGLVAAAVAATPPATQQDPLSALLAAGF
eukprot:2328349-Pleurochrysis_carterae.AAC.5